MRHRVNTRKSGRTSAHRVSMFRNMVSSLIEHEKLETTHEKAREVGRLAERMITLGKRGDLHARRQALRIVRGREAQSKLFGELAERFAGPQRRLHARAAHAPAARRRGGDVDRVAARGRRRPRRRRREGREGAAQEGRGREEGEDRKGREAREEKAGTQKAREEGRRKKKSSKTEE
jgi:large subunit ribosomal protein L17